MRILKYFKGGPDKGLLHTKQKMGKSLEGHGFVDVDQTGSPFDRRSTSG